MRLWPYQMFNVLPYKQMLSQWRECLAISGMLAKDIENKTGINHYIIDRVKDYPIEHFILYCDLVRKEFNNRNWKIGLNTIEKLNNDINFENVLKKISYKYDEGFNSYNIILNYDNNHEVLFENFHNDRYIIQCLYKFQEIYDCNGISKEEWNLIYSKFPYLIDF